ncbi:hypothetical protein DSM25558_5230 [Agrobacterium sp. DSM 25558]|uniref:Uncharacterized protein n=1 Tax=Agrobacterium rosae TaxID=1972867 RepID=A0A1R3U3F2_9HYPH|nr:hypothetical protein DSM25558_5230 [Agrobacterium sp. DSM 25558]SCX36189.1 hypothetical protein DSM25559_5355 [Agrobacterium rosae]
MKCRIRQPWVGSCYRLRDLAGHEYRVFCHLRQSHQFSERAAGERTCDEQVFDRCTTCTKRAGIEITSNPKTGFASTDMAVFSKPCQKRLRLEYTVMGRASGHDDGIEILRFNVRPTLRRQHHAKTIPLLHHLFEARSAKGQTSGGNGAVECILYLRCDTKTVCVPEWAGQPDDATALNDRQGSPDCEGLPTHRIKNRMPGQSLSLCALDGLTNTAE